MNLLELGYKLGMSLGPLLQRAQLELRVVRLQRDLNKWAEWGR